MTNRLARREIPIACMAAAVALRLILHPTRGDTYGALLILLGFGVLNLVFVVPGTWPIRAFSIGLTSLAIAFPSDIDSSLALMAVYAVLLWPALIISSWAMDRGGLRNGDYFDEAADSPDAKRARIMLAVMVATTACGLAAYRLLIIGNLGQTSALFIGLPALLAIATSLFAKSRTAVGVACKAVTIFLLLTLMFLWEGILCIVMAAPIFYALAISIGSAIDNLRTPRDGPSTAFSCLLLLALVPASFEGVTPAMSFSRREVISASKIVRAAPDVVARALRQPPRFDRTPALYLRAGFPRPIAMSVVEGTTRWVIAVRGGEMKINGMEPRTGDVVLALDDDRPGLMHWRVVSDDSHMTHFLWWRESQVEWAVAGAGATRVTWTLTYDRGLDPAFYFGPFERYSTGLAAEYLIDAVATP